VAAQAGLKPGDDIISLGGQPLISIADVSWALHRAPESGALPAVIERRGKEKASTLVLPVKWRAKSDISHRVGTWPLRGMALGGLVLEDLADQQRAKRGLAGNQMALRVKSLGEYGKNAAAKKAGFKKEDVIVEIDGQTDRLTEGELIGCLLEKYQPGTTAKAVVLRGKHRLKLELPTQ